MRGNIAPLIIEKHRVSSVITIKELVETQDEWCKKITEAAEYIDKKLLDNLVYMDLFNDKYCDDSLLELYNTHVYPIITNYNENFTNLCNEYLLQHINDMSLILENTGYLLDSAEETHSFKNSIPSDYVPCLEIEHVWESVKNLKHNISFSPFWQKNNYRVFGNNESVIIESSNKPSTFIVVNRNKFNRSYGETNLEMFERAVNLKNTAFDYEIHIPVLTKSEDNALTGKYEEAVRRHLILRSFMESDNTNDDAIVFESKIDKDGNTTLTDIGYY